MLCSLDAVRNLSFIISACKHNISTV